MSTYDAFDKSSPDFAGFTPPVIKVVGLGGGGCNAVQRMMEVGLRGVEFIAANTDQQVLALHPASNKILLGPGVTRGLGAGGDPAQGRAAAEESAGELEAALQGADMVFLTAGLGGGTGTGAIPVVARIARSVGAITMAVVTLPFYFEIGRRQKNAQEGLSRLRDHANTVITIPNDRLLQVAPRKLPIETAFRLADDVLRQAVQGVAELITEVGMINVDFAHVRRLISQGGGALMAIGHGQGTGKVRQAIEQALHHPLLENGSLAGAAGMIVHFTGGHDLTLWEIQDALQDLYHQADEQTEIVMGVINDERMAGRVQVIMVVTGLGGISLEQAAPGLAQAAKPVTRPVLEAEPEVSSPAMPEREADPHVESPAQEYPPSRPWTAGRAAPATISTNIDLPAFLRARLR